MRPCRITVLKTMYNQELAVKYRRPDIHRGSCPYLSEGQEFIVREPTVMPEDFPCGWAWNDIEPDRILYVQEFTEPGYHFVKFFILCRDFSGELTLEDRDEAESFLVDVGFFSREDLQGMAVHPAVLKGEFWVELESGLRQTKYLGLERIEF